MSTRRVSKSRKRAAFRRLRFEFLEGRLALAVLTVNSLNDGPVNLADATVTLRDAIEAANTDVAVSPGGPSGSFTDEIRFQVQPAETITLLQGQLEIRSSLTITGPGANLLTISANQLSRVFLVNDGVTAERNVTISGLTITDGLVEQEFGGGISSRENLTIVNCVITENFASFGGAGISSGLLTLLNSTISNNAGIGTVSFGGGISAGNVTIRNSTISGNSALISGGMDLANGLIENSTISGNFASQGAGGLRSAGSGLTIRNSTITQNRGGGIAAQSPVVLHNTIVVDNVSGSGSDQTERNIDNLSNVSGTNNLIGTVQPGFNDGLKDGANGNQVGVDDPKIGPLADNGGPTKTHALLAGGPAFDAGNNAQAPSFSIFDQRGAPFLRKAGAKVDIGAFEANPISFIVDTDVDEDDGNIGPGDLSLREAINRSNANGGADTIAFAAEFFSTPHTILLSQARGGFGITDNLTIIGPGADLLSIDGANSAGFFEVNDNNPDNQLTVAISGLTMMRGLSVGAGIRNFESLTVQESVMRDSVALGFDFVGKVGGIGGGISNFGDLTIGSSTISGNQSTFFGGGIYSEGGSLLVLNSTISGNRTGESGGGIFATGSIFVQNSTITGNHANNDNNSTGLGGGVHFSNASVTMHNTIVADNFLGSGTSAESDISAANGAVGTGSSNNLIGTGGSGGLANGVRGNQVNVVDPRLGALADNGGPSNTHALLGGSPAVDAGNDDLITSFDFDQRGEPFPRISGATIDIGAFEAQSISLVVDIDLDEVDANEGPGDLSLREAINRTNTNAGADTITFAPALAGKTIVLTLNELSIVDSLTIQGPPEPITINGRLASRLLDITSTAKDVTIDGLALTGGKTTANSQHGGAIRSRSTGQLTVRDSSIFGNSTAGSFSGGGGIFAIGSLTLVNSTISGNTTAGQNSGGGGINADPVTIINSTISGNSTTGDFARGGGVFTLTSALVLNSTITGNSVAGVATGTGTDGGGLNATDGPVIIRNSIIAGNLDIQGGSHPDLRQANNGPPTVQFSLIGDNNGTGLAAAPVGSPDANGNLIGTHAAPINPQIAPLANNGGPRLTQALCTGASVPVASCSAVSPAINAGSNILLPADTLDLDGDGDKIELIPFDQRGLGFDRVFNFIVDMGAFEVQPEFPWHNFAEPFDVRGGSSVAPDGNIDAGDALAIINYLNAVDFSEVPEDADSGLPFGFLDTNMDNNVAPDDALGIINAINSGFGGEGEPGGSQAGHLLNPASFQSSSSACPYPQDILLSLLAADIVLQPKRRR